MFSKSPLNRMKKRPHEESGLKRPEENLPPLDDDTTFEEGKVSLMTPPIKSNKRPREDPGLATPRKSSLGAGCVKDDISRKIKVFRFHVLLPNGTTVELKMSELRKEILIEEFIDAVRKAYDVLNNQKKSRRRNINWEYQDLYFTDAYANKIRTKIDFCEFSSSNWHLLWLHDGSAEHPDEYEDMWDLTPDTDLLKELPDDYTCETALADLIDNSLQALWSNEAGERRLISVEMQPEKITIFDSGPGMDGANGNIVKWGKMGASLHRSVREKAIGGKPPYLTPFFGMFGYGGPVATMCLGRRAVVSSKVKGSNKVFTLHMEREALVSASHTENCWKTKGGVRDPLKVEKRNSLHGSFTKVEIFDPSPMAKILYTRHLQSKLKDIYFPYIQCDEMSGKTSRPIEFQVNEVDLAEVQGGEVATTNLHSCNGPDFVVQLHFSMRQDSSSPAGQNQRVSTTANARLKCVYFPIVEGTESIQRILNKLDEDGCGIRESFESFSRVCVRRLGRLLPDTRWGLLPFMEPKQKIGEKAKSLKKQCSRVKCFIDTDAGFNPTPHKTDLAFHHPYTKALKNFGNRSREDEEVVCVEIIRDEKKLTLAQLEKLYQDWISDMHDHYDEETDGGVDKPTIIIVSSKIKKLDLTSGVLRVHKTIERKGRCWFAGQNIKVLKGACAGCHKGNVYATLEYIILEGLPGDASGEARLICRPLGLPENKGCRLSVGKGEKDIDINGSSVFPIRIIDSEKCLPVDDNEWREKVETFNQKLPASIDLLSHTECQELEIDGGLPSSLEVGECLPENIVAVIRPKSFNSKNVSKRLDQKFIVRDSLAMTLNISHKASKKGAGGHEHVYSVRLSASSHKGLCGLYVFPLSTEQPLLFQKPGIFTLSFSLIEFKDVHVEHEVQVYASAGVGKWNVINYDKNESYRVRVGSYFKPLSIVCYDRNKKHIRFESIPELVIKLISSGHALAQLCSKKVEITPNKLTMKIKELVIETSELDDIRPNYEATLHISTPDEALYVALQCRVVPGAPRKITTHPSALCETLLPGQVIEEFALEVFDKYGNHVEEHERVLLRLDGFSFQDGSGIIRGVGIDCTKKVGANGRIDLSNALKVSRGYGKRVLLSVISEDEVIFKLHFQTEVRELRAVQKVFMNCEAGSTLENIAFEIIDSEGKVDESIHHEEKHGESHTLAIKCESFRIDDSEQYKFRYGRCTIPSIHLPDTKGVIYFQAVHSRFPDLNSAIKVHVEKSQQDNRDRLTCHADIGDTCVPGRSSSENELILEHGSSRRLHSQVAAQFSKRVSKSALIPQKVHLEKLQNEELDLAMNHEDVGSPLRAQRLSEHEPTLKVSQVVNKAFSPLSSKGFVLPTSSSPGLQTPLRDQRSYEHEPIPVVSPSSRASQAVNEAFSPPSSKGFVLPITDSHEAFSLPISKGFVLPIRDSPALETPKLEHIGAQARSLDIILSKKNLSIEEIGDNMVNCNLQMSRHQENLKSLNLSQLHIQQEILRLQGRDLVSASSFCVRQSIAEQINSRSQSAALVISKLLDEELRRLDIVGLVAHLGTVESIELSRMLAQYLGEDQMLAIVCRNYAAAHSLVTNTLHKLASDLGLSINEGYNAFCLEDIRPKFRELSTDPQGPLRLQDPAMPNGNVPRGFLGYAVNLINIKSSHLRWRTEGGHSLRETLFYSLFGKLQVYKDRDCMMASRSCIKAGAVSLDGGMMRGKGLISLGRWDPKILFPVMNKATCPEKLRLLEAKEMELAKINERIDLENSALKRSTEKFVIYRDEYNSRAT